MTGSSRDEQEHRRRILDHQEKLQAGQGVASVAPPDPQLTMPLIGEVRRPKPPPPKRARPRLKPPVQPRLGET